MRRRSVQLTARSWHSLAYVSSSLPHTAAAAADVTMTSSAAGPLRPDFGSSRSWAAGDVRQRPTAAIDRPEADGAAAMTSR